MISIAVVGSRGHAEWHINNLKSHKFIDKILIYNPSNISQFAISISELLKCDGIIISCPTDYHSDYIQYLMNNSYEGYIYLESLALPPLNKLN